MRISNLYHFTENHRFCVYRDFALSALQQKMLTHVYQPMIGALATGLYLTLLDQLPPDRIGFSTIEQQRRLFFALGFDLNDAGRALLLEQTSKLEAVGLLVSFRKFLPQSDDVIFEYRLQAVLSPSEFFNNAHLTLLLRDKIGKYAVMLLRSELMTEQPEELRDVSIQSEELSIPFYELFQLNTQVIDIDLEQLSQPFQAQQVAGPTQAVDQLQYSQIIARFPRDSQNRLFVEQLRTQPQQMATVNFVAKKYRLSLQEICRLLDEDGIFDDQGELLLERMQYLANLMYRQGKAEEERKERVAQRGLVSEEIADEKQVEMEFYLLVPRVFQGQCDIREYNMVLRNEPYTKVLQLFFQKSAVPDPLLDIFAKLNLNYRLPEPVINVLIHYLHVLNKSWTKAFIDSIAADMLAKQVGTYENAVTYVREQLEARNRKRPQDAQRTNRPGQPSRSNKPRLAVHVEHQAAQGSLSEEEREELRRLAAKLDEPGPQT